MARTLTVARLWAATVFVWLAPSWQPMEGLMPGTTEKPKPDAWEVSNDVSHEACNVQVIAHLLHVLVSEHTIGEPLHEQDHEAAAWLIGQLSDLGERLDSLYETAMDLHRASKHGLKVAS